MQEIVDRLRASSLPDDVREAAILLAQRPRAVCELRAALSWRPTRIQGALDWLAARGWSARVEGPTKKEEQVYELTPALLQAMNVPLQPWTPPAATPS